MYLSEIDEVYRSAMLDVSKQLQNVYGTICRNKQIVQLDKTEITKTILLRLNVFYDCQEKNKHFLNKKIGGAAADFFVESILFFLKVLNEVEGLKCEICSEKPIEQSRIRPDISIWQENQLLAIIECKTQLGWDRETWKSHFQNREKSLQQQFPNAKAFLVVMSEINWPGFGNDSRVGQQFFALSKDIWPLNITQANIDKAIATPIELLFTQVIQIAKNRR